MVRRYKGCYIMIRGSIQEDIIIINIYAPNIVVAIYIEVLLTAIKGEIDSNIVIVGEFNTSLLLMDKSSTQKIIKETQALSDTLECMDLIDIYRAFHSKAAEYTFFSRAHGNIFQNRSHAGPQSQP